MKEFEEFRRRTGIKDVKMDTFTRLWDKYNKGHIPGGYSVTTARTDEATLMDKEAVREILEQMEETKKEMHKFQWGDFAPHKKQKEFWDHKVDAVNADDMDNDPGVYDAEWEYAQKKLPEPVR